MQINGFSQGLQMMQMRGQEQNQNASLTDDQKASLEEILSELDLQNMSAEDHMALGEALKEAEIPPTEETMQIMQEAGLEPMEGMAPPPPPPPMMGMGTMSEEDQTFFNDILSQVQSGEITAEELLSQIEAYTGKTSGTMLDLGA